MTDVSLTNAFLLAAVAVGASWSVAIWILYPLLAPRGAITTRSKRGRQLAAYAAAGVAAVTATRVITDGGNIDRLIAVAVLSPIAWLLAFGVGWLVGPRKSTHPQQPTHSAGPQVEPISSADKWWAEALTELEGTGRHPAVWARCFAEADGDDARARAMYLRVRAGEIRSAQATASATSASTEGRATRSTEEQMQEFGVTHVGDWYEYRSYRYDKLEDALRYARIERARSTGTNDSST